MKRRLQPKSKPAVADKSIGASAVGLKLPVVLGGALLLLAVFLAYLPALNGGFVWDDDSWTAKLLPLFHSPSGLGSIWGRPTALQQYYPLTGTTFWTDYQLWKFWTLPYHVENLLLHVLSAWFFWRLLRRLQLPGAGLAAALFALHPVMVESVAWITERKNVLSLALFLGALLAYERFAPWVGNLQRREGEAARQHGRPFFYFLALLLFLGALLAKTTAFPLPAVILLLAWWKRGRLEWRRDVRPTLPFFAIAIAMCVLTAWLEKNHVGAEGEEFHLTFVERCLVAGHVPWFYLGKLLWPVNLCFTYPRWHPDASQWWAWLYPAGAIGGLVLPWLAQRRIGRGPATAAFYFVGTLFPVLGFINAYGMLYAFVWDHWVYLSSLGFFALVGVLVVRLAERLRQPATVFIFAILILPMLGVLTWRQAGMYADHETLWQTTIRQNPDSWVAHYNLGNVLVQKGRLDEAMTHYREALRLNPQSADAYYNVGNVLLQNGKLDEAVSQYQEALRIKPDFALCQNNLGIVFLQMGNINEAILHFQRAIQIDPDYAEGHNNLGYALIHVGQVDEAIFHYQKALEIKKDFADAHNNLGLAFQQKGNSPEAIRHFKKALQINPDYAKALNNLAWILVTDPQASLRNGEQALELARRANQLTGGTDALTLQTLAAACAETGRFTEAIENAKKGMELARAAGQADLMKQIEKDLGFYSGGMSSHPAAK